MSKLRNPLDAKGAMQIKRFVESALTMILAEAGENDKWAREEAQRLFLWMISVQMGLFVTLLGVKNTRAKKYNNTVETIEGLKSVMTSMVEGGLVPPDSFDQASEMMPGGEIPTASPSPRKGRAGLAAPTGDIPSVEEVEEMFKVKYKKNPSAKARKFISDEISHLVRDKGYEQRRAVAAAFSVARKKGFIKNPAKKNARTRGVDTRRYESPLPTTPIAPWIDDGGGHATLSYPSDGPVAGGFIYELGVGPDPARKGMWFWVVTERHSSPRFDLLFNERGEAGSKREAQRLALETVNDQIDSLYEIDPYRDEKKSKKNPVLGYLKDGSPIEGSGWIRGRKNRRRNETLTTRERRDIPTKDFALSGRRYPIDDRGHAISAKGYATQMFKKGYITKAQREKINRKADKFLASHPKRNPDWEWESDGAHGIAPTKKAARAAATQAERRMRLHRKKAKSNSKRKCNPSHCTVKSHKHRKRNPLLQTVSLVGNPPTVMSPPFKQGQKVKVEVAWKWISENGTDELKKHFKNAMKLATRTNKEPKYVKWEILPIGSKNKLDNVTAMVNYGTSDSTLYQAPKGSKKGKHLYEHKWGDEGHGKPFKKGKQVPLLVSHDGKTIIHKLGPGQTASNADGWMSG